MLRAQSRGAGWREQEITPVPVRPDGRHPFLRLGSWFFGVKLRPSPAPPAPPRQLQHHPAGRGCDVMAASCRLVPQNALKAATAHLWGQPESIGRRQEREAQKNMQRFTFPWS
ncbi:hypothetical protein NN561_003327 [Cricetulus griseus]